MSNDENKKANVPNDKNAPSAPKPVEGTIELRDPRHKLFQEERIGKFNLPKEQLEELSPEAMEAYKSAFVPVHIMPIFHPGHCYAVTAYSEKFLPVKKGEKVPKYDIQFKEKSDGEISIIANIIPLK